MDQIDAHCHFWDPARGDYDWLESGPPSLDPLRRPYTPQELARQNGNRQVIAVQAAASVAETRYLLGLAATNPQIVGVVGWVDLTTPDSKEVLQELCRNPAFRGIRPMLQDLAEDDWILKRPAPAILQTIRDLGLCFDALVLTRHLPHLARFVRANPNLQTIVDHCAKPRMDGPLDPAWRSGMSELAAFPHVLCKLSGLLTELPDTLRHPDAALAAMRPVFSEVLDRFGPGRLVWGSDWPVLTLAAEHDVWGQLTDRLLEGLSKTEREAILGGNAASFYGLAEPVRKGVRT